MVSKALYIYEMLREKVFHITNYNKHLQFQSNY